MRTIAIIPARGGSKRIPGKNVKEFEGQPIIAYSIRAALGAGCFDEVMVSTDSEEIAAVARRYGASVPFLRSEKTSDDYATTADVIRDADAHGTISAEEASRRASERIAAMVNGELARTAAVPGAQAVTAAPGQPVDPSGTGGTGSASSQPLPTED